MVQEHAVDVSSEYNYFHTRVFPWKTRYSQFIIWKYKENCQTRGFQGFPYFNTKERKPNSFRKWLFLVSRTSYLRSNISRTTNQIRLMSWMFGTEYIKNI